MPAPIFLLIMAFGVVLPIVLTSMSFRQKRWKMEFNHRQNSAPLSDNADELSKNELKDLIRDAVKEANAPLLQRIAELELKQTAMSRTDAPLLQNDMYAMDEATKSVGKAKVS